MNQKLWVAVAVVATFSLAGAVHVLAQTNQPQGHWQLVASNGGDGVAAWKYNPDTGQSYFCYRQNCFAQVVMLPPAKQ
jgi:hypothetical protein